MHACMHACMHAYIHTYKVGKDLINKITTPTDTPKNDARILPKGNGIRS